MGVQVVQLVVIIHQRCFHLLPAPQNQEDPVSAHHVELIVWETRGHDMLQRRLRAQQSAREYDFVPH